MLAGLRKWLLRAGERVAFGLFGIICFYLFALSIFSTCVIWYDTEGTYYLRDFPMLLVCGLLGMTGVLAWSSRILKKVLQSHIVLLCILTLVWGGLLTGFVINTDLDLVHDQRAVYQGIQGFISGDYTMWEQEGYLYHYPFQNGLVLLYAPLMMVFGENTYWAAQAVNMLFYGLLAAGVYRLAKEYFGKTVALFSYAGILFFFPLWGYVKFFYGNLPGLSLGVWSVCLLVLFMRCGRWRYMLSSAGCMLLAVVYKSNLLIFAIAMLIVLFVEAFGRAQIQYFLAALCLLAAVLAGMRGPAWIMQGITGCVTDGGIPSVHWVAMGLHESSAAPGWYSGDSGKWFAENGYSVSRSSRAAWESISESVALFGQEKAYALRFFGRKLASVWNNPTFEGFAVVVRGNLRGTLDYWMKDILYSGGIGNTVLTIFLDILQSVYLFGTILYLLYCRKERNLRAAIPLAAFIGGFLMHIFWEGKCQYAILYFVLIIPYAFAGYRECVRRIGIWAAGKQKWKRACRSREVRIFGIWMAVLLLIGLCNSTVLQSCIKLQGDESGYIWMCREYDWWKSDDFTKEGIHE